MLKNIKSKKKPIKTNYMIFLLLRVVNLFYFMKKRKRSLYPKQTKITNESHKKNHFTLNLSIDLNRFDKFKNINLPLTLSSVAINFKIYILAT